MKHLEKVFIGVILLLNDLHRLLAIISSSSVVSRRCRLKVVSRSVIIVILIGGLVLL